jgi:hypothetical protein
MSKLLWKTLFVSPAILGVTLVVSRGVVHAVDSTSVSSANELNPTEAVQPLTAEVQIPQPPPIASMEALMVQQTPGLATTATKAPVEPAEAQVNVPAQVAISQELLNPATTQSEELPPSPSVPKADPTLAQATPAVPNNSSVLEQINRYSREGNRNSINQVTNVTQLSDVSPGDWAYEALQSLVERYGCIAGYPDGTYRGNRALTRYEFAAGLNACLQQVERLIAASVSDFVTREDLETLQRLVQEFEAELATLGTRVDDLEGRVAFLEDNQFSTTTKLVGEVIFAATDSFTDIDFGDRFNNDVFDDDDTNTIFGNRVRLELQTSFTGQDILRTRLQAGNLEAITVGPGSAQGTQTFNLFENDNDITLDWLSYTFPFGSSKIYVAAFGGIHSDYAPTLNPYFEDYDGGNGALSTFASESPIYRIGGGAGAAISLGVGPLESILGPSTLTVGYLAGNAAEPGEDAGLFNGDYAALAQLNFNIGDRIGIGATFVHGYHDAFSPIFGLGAIGDSSAATFSDQVTSGVVGTFGANNPSAIASFAATGSFDSTAPIVTNSYGIEAAFRLTDTISISGFGTFTDAILLGQGGAEIWTYGAGVAFSDLGKEGNILGIFAGAQPYVGSIDALGQNLARDQDRPYHIEAFYKYQLTDNISVTPGVIWLTAPNQGDDDAVIGTLRTTFRF